MQYELLEEAGTLEVSLTGQSPDLDALGVLQTHLQEIVDRVAYWVAFEGGMLPPTSMNMPHLRRLGRAFRLGQPGYLVKGRLLKASTGSLIQEIGIALAVVVADPDMRAVLQNLAANVVWAISVSGVRGLRQREGSVPFEQNSRYRNRLDPVDVGPNLRTILLALAESGQAGELHFRTRARGVEQEVSIKISSGER
ncbi:MAG: hypothetical protein L0312_06590 [Acidobacteria bacterium]|nr:hypothetical protein [Acidobacteriota bacterium]